MSGLLVGRVRVVVAGFVFGACAFVSLAANVSTAEASVAGRAVQAWPVVAVIVAEVLVVWIPGLGWQFRLRQVVSLGLGCMALAMSYTHMETLAKDVGLEGWEARFWPATVDGLMVLSGLTLHELQGSTRRASRKKSGSSVGSFFGGFRSGAVAPAVPGLVSAGVGDRDGSAAVTAPRSSTPAPSSSAGRSLDEAQLVELGRVIVADPKVTAGALAEEFGVSVKTIRRSDAWVNRESLREASAA